MGSYSKSSGTLCSLKPVQRKHTWRLGRARLCGLCLAALRSRIAKRLTHERVLDMTLYRSCTSTLSHALALDPVKCNFNSCPLTMPGEVDVMLEPLLTVKGSCQHTAPAASSKRLYRN